MNTRIEYIWLDGKKPLPQLRSKTRFVKNLNRSEDPPPPVWNFDGGSTKQGDLKDSDRALRPVRLYDDPFNKGGKLALCEVEYHDGTPHESNTRTELRESYSDRGNYWVGIEQEFTLINPTDKRPLGLSLNPKEQGQYYCGVGCLNQIGRYIIDEFVEKCELAGLELYGINAEVMPGQWEFQTTPQDPLKTADDLWVARYILERVAETKPVVISYHPKPHMDFNGAGCHTNISTEKMRESFSPEDQESLMTILEEDHSEYIGLCGQGVELRLTGECETSSYLDFSWGCGDRGASIRIPAAVAKDGAGYIEDRRPCANIDPYRILSALICSINKSNLL